jgi:hypothetical protein
MFDVRRSVFGVTAITECSSPPPRGCRDNRLPARLYHHGARRDDRILADGDPFKMIAFHPDPNIIGTLTGRVSNLGRGAIFVKWRNSQRIDDRCAA